MNKLNLILLGILTVLLAILVGFALTNRSNAPLGFSITEPTQANVTSTAISCAINTTTSVLAHQSGRTSFMAQNISTSSLYLCRTTGSSSCSATSGITLYGTSTSQTPFIQLDGYQGPYVCSASTANATVTIIYSQ